MSYRDNIHALIKGISMEVLSYIKEQETQPQFTDRWVPAADIKNSLDLSFVAVPKANKQYGEKGWFFAIIARILEDKNLIEYKKVGSRTFCRSLKKDQ